MKTKTLLLCVAMLMGISALANDVWNYHVYDDCSKNGYRGGYCHTPANVQAVDLGLPSGLKWASCNVGAEKPEDYGNYYAWGEVLPKEDYSWTTYKYANGAYDRLTKYCYDSPQAGFDISSFGENGFTDSKTILDPEDDAAYVNLGSNWRMPTDVEWTELREYCSWQWTIQNGAKGYKVTSNTNGNSIFLPYTRFRGWMYSEDPNYYWSSSIHDTDPFGAWCISIDSNYVWRENHVTRERGLCVRPVYQFSKPQMQYEWNFFCLTLYAKGCDCANVIGCEAGQQINITAVLENKHRHFVRWADGCTDSIRQITVTRDTTFIAEFADDPILTIISSEKNRGFVSKGGQYKPNTSCMISATARYGYHFTQWADGNTDNPRTIILTCDTTFTAEFAPNRYNIFAEVNDSVRGDVNGATMADYLDSVTLTATSNYGYHFTYWTDGNTENPRMVQVVSDKTYTAVFEKNMYTITAQAANGMQGDVYAPTQAEYLDEVTLTANPNVGYHFTQWTDGNTNNPRTLILTCDTAFTAEFAQTFSGQCGENLYWAHKDHTLTISGTGAMYDYSEDDVPWLLFRDTTDAVLLERGITHIGTYAFNAFVKLHKIELPNTLISIGANAFAGCRKLEDVYAYSIEPPVAEQSSFTNYNVYVHIPRDNLRAYQMDAVFGTFKYVRCISADSADADDDMTVTPSDNEATITWPTEDNAGTYTITIKKDGVVFCTLTFNANGQLTNISFAPGRNGRRHTPAAQLTARGYQFTVTGLTESTRYACQLDVKDASDNILKNYSGEFTTTSGTTAVDNAEVSVPVSKIIRAGQIFILRGGKTYTTTGVEVQ